MPSATHVLSWKSPYKLCQCIIVLHLVVLGNEKKMMTLRLTVLPVVFTRTCFLESAVLIVPETFEQLHLDPVANANSALLVHLLEKRCPVPHACQVGYTPTTRAWVLSLLCDACPPNRTGRHLGTDLCIATLLAENSFCSPGLFLLLYCSSGEMKDLPAPAAAISLLLFTRCFPICHMLFICLSISLHRFGGANFMCKNRLMLLISSLSSP